MHQASLYASVLDHVTRYGRPLSDALESLEVGSIRDAAAELQAAFAALGLEPTANLDPAEPVVRLALEREAVDHMAADRALVGVAELTVAVRP